MIIEFVFCVMIAEIFIIASYIVFDELIREFQKFKIATNMIFRHKVKSDGWTNKLYDM